MNEEDIAKRNEAYWKRMHELTEHERNLEWMSQCARKRYDDGSFALDISSLYTFLLDEDELEDRLLMIKNDPEIDNFIWELLLDLNENGYYTWSSCSGLVEDHLCEFPYNDDTMSPFIAFIILNRSEIERKLQGTKWVIYGEHKEYDTIFVGIGTTLEETEMLTDKEIIAEWDILRTRLLGDRIDTTTSMSETNE